MAHDDEILVDGEVEEALKGGTFRVKLDNGHKVIAHLSGKMRKFRIRVVAGDKVQVALTVYDLNRGRITYRR